MEKKLYRSRTDRMILGVCGGLAKYLGMDVSLVRIITVLLAIATGGFGVLAYFIMAIIVPVEGSQKNSTEDVIKENAEDIKNTAQDFGKKMEETLADKKRDPEAESLVHARRRNILGIIIIVIGVLVLVSVTGWFHWHVWTYIWPLVLIAIGILIIVSVSMKR
jgi:phage shock protein C